MKKILILSLISLSLFYLVSCKVDSVKTGIPAGIPGNRKTTYTTAKNEDDVQASVPIFSCSSDSTMQNALNDDNISTMRFHLIFDNNHEYIGAYDTMDKKLIVDKNKDMNKPFSKLGYLIGQMDGVLVKKGSSKLSNKSVKNVTPLNLKGDFDSDKVCDFTYSAKLK